MLSGDLDGVSKVLSVLLLKCAEAEKRLEYTKAEQFIESMERNMMRYMKEGKLKVDDSQPA